NVLHLHLSDDEGFRVESRRHPRLQEYGSDGKFYTQAQILEMVAYACDRGIRVVPEFDIPGHSTSWLVAYPQYGSTPGPYALARNVLDIKDPAFDPTREEVYEFIDGFLGEMTALFPDAYWHIGGDQVTGKHWDSNPAIQTFKAQHGFKDNAALQVYFNQRLMQLLNKHGKKMMGWDEVLHPELPRETVIQSWRDAASLAAAAKQGFHGILSAGYYLDHMETAATHYAVDPLPEGEKLEPAQAARILGGEACMWGEYEDAEIIDSRTWPRTAAIAERLWSPREVNDSSDMYRRLERVSVQLEEAGITHLSGPEVMLRRLAVSANPGALLAFHRLVEPVNQDERYEGPNPPTSLTPLVRLTDIATPDACGRREVGRMVDGLLHDAPRYGAFHADLEREFKSWQDLPSALAALAEHAPLVQ